MRLLHLVGRSHGRGAELAALELARALDARGHENVVLACNRAFDGREHPAFPALSRRTRLGPLALAENTMRLRRRLRQERFQAVIAHGGWPLNVAVLARYKGGPRLVWQRILGFPKGWRWSARRPWWQAMARRTDAAVALTQEMGDELRGIGFGGPIWRIPNFREPDRFVGVDRASESARLRAELGLDSDVALLGLVGHLIEQKRPKRAVEVVGHVQSAGLHAHLVVAGDGPLRDDMKRIARERGLEKHVHLLGHRHDVERILGGVDLVLLTSDDEGIPGILIEAQMAGCPVVTFPFAGASSVVADGETGIVLPRADVALMATEVGRLLARRDELERLGSEGRARSVRFSTEYAADLYEKYISELVDNRSSNPSE